MALFGTKKNTKKEEKAVAVVAEKKPKAVKAVRVVSKGDVSSSGTSFADSIIQPRITEKATFQSEKGVYVFEVTGRATKKTIAMAIRQLYKVTPVKVRIAKNPAKQVFVRGKWGRKQGVKKAYVALAKGDKIEIS
jgi:large subunit ribosomal protein L23